VIFTFIIPGGVGTCAAESFYDAREYLRARAVDVSTITLAPDLDQGAWTAPPANATPADIAADYARTLVEQGFREGLRVAANHTRKALTASEFTTCRGTISRDVRAVESQEIRGTLDNMIAAPSEFLRRHFGA
jgi:hypothetical protein